MLANMLSLQLLLLIAAIPLPAFAEITLSGFQQIVSFPQSCTEAYNQPISACSPTTDVGPGHTCSAECVLALTAIQTSIMISCRGIEADPSSVIGEFFLGQGPAYVCSGIPYSDVGSTQSMTLSSQESVSTATMPTKTQSRKSTEAATSTGAATSTSDASKSSHKPQPYSTTESTTTTSTSTITPSILKTVTNSAKTTGTGTSTTVRPSFLSTAADKGTATTFTSQSQRTSSSNPDNFGGGGSPFEISPNAAAAGPRGESRPWLIVAMVILGVCHVWR